MIKGIFNSDSGIQGETAPGFASAILRTQVGGTAPLLALSAGMKSQDLSGVWSVMWIGEQHNTGRLQVAANVASATTTSITLKDASSVLPNQFYLVEATGERIFVIDVSGNVLTVVRGFQDTTSKAAAIATDAYIQRIGTAFPEASNAPSSAYELGMPDYNVTQIVRTGWDVSNTAAVITYKTGARVANSIKQAGQFHAEDIERILWYGRRFMMKAGGKPFRTMGGVEFFNTQNITTVASNGTTGFSDINSFLETIFTRNIDGQPNERLAFCGNTVISVINEIVKDNSQMNITPGITDYGMRVLNWMCPFGSISLMTHPMFNQNAVWSRNLWLLHPASMVLRYLRRTMPYAITGDGVDAQRGGFTTELTAEFHAPDCNGAMLNVHEAAVAA